MILAVDDQLVIPITTTMISRLTLMPKMSIDPVSSTSRMIAVRMIARTNVGRTRKKSAMRIVTPVEPAPDVAGGDAEHGADEDGHERGEQPDDHRDPGGVDGEVQDRPAQLIGPEWEGRGWRLEVTTGRRHRRLQRADEQGRHDGENREDHQDHDAGEPVRPAQQAQDDAERSTTGPAPMRGARRGDRDDRHAHERTRGSSSPYSRSASRFAPTTDTLRSRKTPWSTG